jgi:hypothetical protein
MIAKVPGAGGAIPLRQAVKLTERGVSPRPWKLMWGLAIS